MPRGGQSQAPDGHWGRSPLRLCRGCDSAYGGSPARGLEVRSNSVSGRTPPGHSWITACWRERAESRPGDVRMLGWFHRLLPREERFFDLFVSHSEAVVAGAQALRGMLEGGDAIPRNYEIVMQREHD